MQNFCSVTSYYFDDGSVKVVLGRKIANEKPAKEKAIFLNCDKYTDWYESIGTALRALEAITEEIGEKATILIQGATA